MIDIAEVDLKDPEVRKRILELQKMAFAEFDMDLLRHILIQSDQRTTAVGAFINGKMVGVNGFIAHEVCNRGRIEVAYQSCMSATDPEYLGKGIFTSIINEGKNILAKKGGAFIFGYPNSKSAPIFAKKLGFSEQPMVVIDIPLRPSIVSRLLFDANKYESAMNAHSVISFDARKTAEWKATRPSRQKVQSVEHYTNFAFGRVSEKRIGIVPVRIFQCGGYELNKPHLFSELLRGIASKVRCHIARLVVASSSPMAHSFRVSRIGRKTEPLITFPLNANLNGQVVDAWSGLKDVF